MAKIRLDVSQLNVETFDLLPEGAETAGTVRGHNGEAAMLESPLNPSCYGTCGVTCETQECPNTCPFSCDDTTCTCPPTCPVTCNRSCPPCFGTGEFDCTMDYGCQETFECR